MNTQTVEQQRTGNFTFRSVFLGAKGLRSGWRLALFVILLVCIVAVAILTIRAGRAMLALPQPAADVMTPGRGLLNEAVILFGVMLTSSLFARFERRSLADYGLPFRRGAARRFLEGALWGVAMMSFVLLVLHSTGNFDFGPVALSPEKIVTYGVLWAIVFTMVGVAETFAFSGYPLFALSRGIGFWPAAAVLALLFGGIHFVTNAGENWLGSASLIVVGFMVAFILQQTGDLWFAIGMHGAWDWAQTYLYGVPNSGLSFTGHLLSPTFYGAEWLTGGTAGPEASLVTVCGYVLGFALIRYRFPKKRYVLRRDNLLFGGS